MLPQVAFCFGLLGIAMFGFGAKDLNVRKMSQYLLHFVTVYTSDAIISYLYGLSFRDATHFEDQIVFWAALLIFVNSIAASLLNPNLGVTRLFIGHRVGNKMARRLFTLLAFVIMIFGAFRERSLNIKLFSFDTNFSLLTVCLLLVSLAIIWNTAMWLNRIDIKRREAEEEVKVMNEELEKRVDERSAELYSLLERYRESESQLTAAFEFSAIGMALVSLDGGWIKVNKRLCEMVGYTEEELLAMSFLGITHPEDVDIHINPIERVLNSESRVLRIEKRYIHKNGEAVWVSVNFAVIRDYKNVPMYLVSQIEDITERKSAEAAQKLIIENEERLRAIFDNVDGATSLMDTETRLIVFNHAFATKQTMLTGRVPQVGDELYYYLSAEEKKGRLKIINRVLKGNKETFEVSYVKDERQLYYRVSFAPVMVNGRVTAISSYSIDLTASKEAENLLRKSEEKYHSLIEHASDAIYVFDKNGHFTEANESMCKMTGYTRDELLQLNVSQLLEPGQLREEPLSYPHRPAGQAVIRERCMVRKNGETFEVEANVKIFPDRMVLVIARDITDRKRMEKELREAELKFRTLAEKSMVGVYISQNHRFIYVNPRFAEIFGYEQHELINTEESAVKIIIGEEDQTLVWENVQARYSGETEIMNYEVSGKKKDGARNRVEFYGSSVIIDGTPSIIGTMLDVTERSRAEEVLKRSEANLKTIMDTTDTAYALLDKDLNVIAFNQMTMKFVKSQMEELPANAGKLSDYFPEEKFPEFITYAEEVLKGKNISYEVNYQQADGVACWYYTRLFPITNEKKEILGLMLALSDVTERKNAENSLKTAYKLIQDHIDSIKQMAWKQSHLIRSPLANLMGLVAMLDDDPLDSEVRKNMKIELERLDKVIIEMAEEASVHNS
jgi:PAS domain S-box-containing protein